ncbi:deoxyribose-phosphate aldolase [Flavobacteriaceae bacterium MAR_2010_188]|nr:deoxyribose-phosphate aldolase [Flavobacteriaceae bacterium MAR_2010_188]
MDINSYIDHTLLLPTATESDIIKLCIEAKEYKFHSVCINSSYVTIASQLLMDSDVKISAAVGFPLGANTTDSKIYEAREAIRNGADEIDMVINIGLLKSRNNIAVLKDLADVKIAIGSAPLKTAIEISELSKNEIIRACEICLDARVDYIKTSTGFSKSGATLTAVKIMKKTIREAAQIKASGGIREYDIALRYLDFGVTRIGTTTAVSMLQMQQQAKTENLNNRIAV